MSEQTFEDQLKNFASKKLSAKMNADTKCSKVAPGLNEITYIIPPNDLEAWFNPDSSTYKNTIRLRHFTDGRQHISLAYATEIDTIFWRYRL